jgi:hypothetical protein
MLEQEAWAPIKITADAWYNQALHKIGGAPTKIKADDWLNQAGTVSIYI